MENGIVGMSVHDWTACYNQNDEAVNLNPLAPKWSFRLMVIGGSGCGKTNMVVDLMMNHIYYKRLYVMAKDLEEPLYQFLQDFFRRCKQEQGDEAVEVVFSSDLADLPHVDDLDKSEQTLIIFDDFITSKNQKPMMDYFVRGRKKNASLIYITQSYYDVPKMVRLNAQYFAIFGIGDKKELRSIADTHSSKVDFDTFMRLYQEATNKPHGFLVIDNRTQHLPMHLRDKWDGLYML